MVTRRGRVLWGPRSRRRVRRGILVAAAASALVLDGRCGADRAPEPVAGGAVPAPVGNDPVGNGPVGVAGRLRAGWRAVALGRDIVHPQLADGQRVDLYAGADGFGTAGTAPTGLLSAGAEVLAGEDEQVTVAVPEADAPAVARAAAGDRIVVVVRPTP